MKKHEFIKLAKERQRLIGLPNKWSFKKALKLIENEHLGSLEFLGPLGQAEARCYWNNGEHGGYVYVPKKKHGL